MDQMIRAAQERRRPRDLAIFTIIRYTGMRRGSVAALCVRHLYAKWGLRRVPVKGGKTRDIPLPTRHPWRWRHLVSAAQASAISYSKNIEVYEEAIELLHA
jgi:integrase